jgi:glutathione peroxidase
MASLKQQLLRFLYPFIKNIGKSGNKGTVLTNTESVSPPTSFYQEQILLNNNQSIDLNALKGKKIIIVNTASDCGYTGQYAELQKLYEKHQQTLLIIAVPSNNFNEQEKGSDAKIATFCEINYGVTFPLAKKDDVLKTPQQLSIYNWLTHADLNGWCNHEPDWNFGKYIINETGILTHYFGPSVSPLDKEFMEALGVS